MQVEITTEGQLVGSNIFIDGDRLPKVLSIKLEIDERGSTLQVECFRTDDEGKFVKGQDQEIIVDRYTFSGGIKIEGELLDKVVVDSFEKDQLGAKIDKLTQSIEQLKQAPKHFTTSTDPVRDLRQVRELGEA